MFGELVTAVTSDTVRLQGFFCQSRDAPRVSAAKGSVDAALLVHGLGGNFYSSRLLMHVSESLLGLGVSVLLINTRGHDMVNTLPWGGRAQTVGAAFENVDHCRFDLSAWTEFLFERGLTNVMLVGHSLGAIKSLYAHTHVPELRIQSIIGLSATRLSYRKLIDSPEGQPLRETIQRCTSLVEAGQGTAPIAVTFPFPTWMTPQCYLDKYGPAERFNWMHFIDRIRVPTLLLFGARELQDNPVFTGLQDELDQLQQRWLPLTIDIIPDADHFYTSRFSEVDQSLVSWLTT